MAKPRPGAHGAVKKQAGIPRNLPHLVAVPLRIARRKRRGCQHIGGLIGQGGLIATRGLIDADGRGEAE